MFGNSSKPRDIELAGLRMSFADINFIKAFSLFFNKLSEVRIVILTIF